MYCRRKENGVNILKSIDEGPFQMGMFKETVVEGEEDALHLGTERARVYSDLLPKDKERHFWDNVKMLLEGSELTKEDRELMLYDDFEHFRYNKGENIHNYYVRVDRIEVKGTMQGEQVHLVIRELKIELGMLIRVKQGKSSVTIAMENGVVLDEEQLLFIAGGQDNAIDKDVDELPDAFCEHHEVHEMHDDVQPNCVVDSDAKYMGDSNMIPYDQYVKDNTEPVV
nr:hypothetical protein [Tanacetum cinerariifolium]